MIWEIIGIVFVYGLGSYQMYLWIKSEKLIKYAESKGRKITKKQSKLEELKEKRRFAIMLIIVGIMLITTAVTGNIIFNLLN